MVIANIEQLDRIQKEAIVRQYLLFTLKKRKFVSFQSKRKSREEGQVHQFHPAEFLFVLFLR